MATAAEFAICHTVRQVRSVCMMEVVMMAGGEARSPKIQHMEAKVCRSLTFTIIAPVHTATIHISLSLLLCWTEFGISSF